MVVCCDTNYSNHPEHSCNTSPTVQKFTESTDERENSRDPEFVSLRKIENNAKHIHRVVPRLKQPSLSAPTLVSSIGPTTIPAILWSMTPCSIVTVDVQVTRDWPFSGRVVSGGCAASKAFDLFFCLSSIVITLHLSLGCCHNVTVCNVYIFCGK